MPKYCSVVCCGAQVKRDGVKLFGLPPSMKERIIWLKITGRPESWKPPATCFICSRHFIDGKPTKESPYPTITGISSEEPTTSKPLRKRRVKGKLEIQFCESKDAVVAGEIQSRQKLPAKRKKFLEKPTGTEVFGKYDHDHCYLAPLKPASQPTEVNASYSDSDDGEGKKFITTLSQPTPLVKIYLRRKKRLSLANASAMRARELALKFMKR